jgi:hypothetical protein
MTDRISNAELRVWLEWLGLDSLAASRILNVRHDTVRRWLSGRELIPIRIEEELSTLEQLTAQSVEELIHALKDAREVVVVIHRTDQEMWNARPDLKPYPARWWRMVVARATVEVPGVEIRYQ